ALEANREADLRDRVIGVAEQRGGALQAPGEQVGVRRFAEGSPKLTAEMGAGEPGGASEVVHVERLEIARVRQVLGAEQMAGGRDEGHCQQYGRPRAEVVFTQTEAGDTPCEETAADGN